MCVSVCVCVCIRHLTCEHQCLHLQPGPGIPLSLKVDNVLIKSLADSVSDTCALHVKAPFLLFLSAGSEARAAGERASTSVAVFLRGDFFPSILFLAAGPDRFLQLQLSNSTRSLQALETNHRKSKLPGVYIAVVKQHTV